MLKGIEDINYQEVMEYSLDPIILHTDYKILYINKAAEEFFRTDKESVIGISPLDIFKESSKGAIKRRIQSAYDSPAAVIEETIYRMDKTTVTVELYCHPVMLGENNKAIQSYIRDITIRKESEKKQEDMLQEINELSATIVPIMSNIAILPLTGNICEDKAGMILEIIPEKVKDQALKYLIIDFSGVYRLDDVVIDSLFKIIHVLSLLGVQAVLTGLRPEMAIEATKLGINLSDVPTLASVKDALVYLGIH
ncbi:UNVERIFIED_CONTAM: PAS domain S-box protein [Halobacillus marinus]|uniref:PAS domain S-box protein n=1 Tax=Bacillaceae TaxID=186817 RepID=UPI0004248336|nr:MULTISPECIES: PAS domain S-box protein [Bacillaceae]QHT47921.1 PAS domain S-box protein [Bacillus sp. SB49]